MKGSILIFGGNKVNRKILSDSFIKDAHSTETLLIESEEGKKSIGIGQVRDGIKFLQKRPVSGSIKAVVVRDAEKLTTEAQNAFLKTLEEPPSYAVIVLEAKTQDSLLPTVISRCQKVFAGTEESRGAAGGGGDTLEKIKKMSVDEKLNWAQEEAKEERDDIVELLEKWVSEERENFGRQPSAAQNIEIILEISSDLQNTNVNARLALETLILNLL